MTLPELAIKRHVTTLMLIVSLVVLGGVAMTRLPLAFLPDMEEPELFVRLPYPSASPEQIERMIVRPVEEALGAVKGLKQMWSRCSDDSGFVRLEFDWATDMHLARVEVWEKLDRIRGELPEDVGDITVATHWNSQEADDPVLEGRLSSKRNLSENYDLLEQRVVRPLQRIPGVAQVRLDGVNPREVRINLRLADLELHRMDVREVSRILRRSNFNQSLGKIVEGDRRYTLRTIGSFVDIEQIRNLTLRGDGLRLRNVADVEYREPPLEYGRHLDGKFAVGLTVSTESKANVVAVCDALEKRIAALRSDPELEGLQFLVWFNQGKEIKKTLGQLFYAGVFGALLASLVLYVFLRRFSTTLVAAACIPFSLIVACGILWLNGRTLNTLTLLGLIVGIGMLVDNAVVVIENIFRHQEEGKNRRSASLIGAREVSVAVVTATLTSVIVFLPIVFNKPSELNIPLKEIGITVCLTLLASLFVSQTLIPLATSWFIRTKPRPKEPWMRRLELQYERVLALHLRHAWMAPVIGIAVTASALYPFFSIERKFTLDRQDIFAQIHYKFSEEKTLDEREQLITHVETFLDDYRDELNAKSIYSWWSDRWSMTRVYLRDGEATQENVTRVRQRLREILPEIAGVRLEVTENRRAWRHDRGKRVAFRVFGEDSEVLADLAEEARTRIARIPGLENTFASNEQGRQEIHVTLDRDLVSRYDVPPASVAEVVGLTFRGRRLQRFRTPAGEREMRLTLDEKDAESVVQLQNLPFWSEQGEKLPLASVAKFNEVRGPHRIERSDRNTSVWVGAEYEMGTRDDYVPAVEAALAAMTFPYGYGWTFGSWQQRQRETSNEYVVNLLLALMLVFGVMASLFESVRQAIALMIALPFALSGAIWTLYLTGTDFDIPAAMGVLLLVGIVVNNGIVMIEHINTYRRQGMDRHEALLKGGRERLRPILMTAMTTLIGLVPMLIQRPSFGGTYYYSMAYVVIGGIALSTLLTSLLLPATVVVVEDCGSALRRFAVRCLRVGGAKSSTA